MYIYIYVYIYSCIDTAISCALTYMMQLGLLEDEIRLPTIGACVSPLLVTRVSNLWETLVQSPSLKALCYAAISGATLIRYANVRLEGRGWKKKLRQVSINTLTR